VVGATDEVDSVGRAVIADLGFRPGGAHDSVQAVVEL
jgi:hypothetical protein